MAHILGVLRSHLYSDKIGAVVREYLCNALDAHIEAGQERPVLVGAPTGFSPYFTVRDYGPGMSHEQMFELFTSYGDSTKRDSNAYTGMFGVGSKSAYAYSDSFNVLSWFEGKKRTYVCYLDESHRGKIALLGEEDSDEPSGVEINVPVKASDFFTFVQKIEWFWAWSDLKFDVQGMNAPAWNGRELPYHFESGNWKHINVTHGHVAYSKLGSLTRFGNHLVIMGHVAYHFTYEDLPGAPQFLQSTNLVIFAPLGALDISASRERPQFTSKTVQYLKDIVMSIPAYVRQQVETELAEARSLLHASLMWQTYKGAVRTVLGTNVNTQSVVEWNGQPVVAHIDFETLKAECPGLQFHQYYNSGGRMSREKNVPQRCNGHWALQDRFYLAFSDLFAPLQRLRGAEASVYHTFHVLAVPAGNQALYDSVLQKFAGLNLVELHTLPVGGETVEEDTFTPPSRFNPKIQCYTWDWKTNDWTEAEVDLDAGEEFRLWLPIYRFYVDKHQCPLLKWPLAMQWGSPDMTTRTESVIDRVLDPLWKHLHGGRSMSQGRVVLYGVKSAHVNKLVGQGWTRADEWAFRTAKSILANHENLAKQIGMVLKQQQGWHAVLELPWYKYLPAEHFAGQLNEIVCHAKKTATQFRWLWEIIKLRLNGTDRLIPTTSVAELSRKIMNRYPLLMNLQTPYRLSDQATKKYARQIALYIRSVDRCAEQRLQASRDRVQNRMNNTPEEDADVEYLPTH